MSKKKPEPVETGPWKHVVGGISHTAMWTIFHLSASINGLPYGQEVHVRTARLEKHPEIFKRTLDWMVRDIEEKLR